MPNLITKLTLDKGQFDRNIAGATKKVRDMDKQFKTLGKGLSSFGSGLGMNIGALGGLTTAIGAAALAGEGLKKVLESNQITGDALAGTLSTVAQVTNNFAVALGTADFSAFNQGLGEMIRKSREAYDALDQLGNTSMSFNYFAAKNTTQIKELGNAVKDALAGGDVAAATKSYEEAAAIIAQQKTYSENARKRVDEAVVTSIAAASTLYAGDITRGDIEDALRVDLMGNPQKVRAELTAQYDEYVKMRKKILEEKGKSGFNYGSLIGSIPLLGNIAQAAGLDASLTTKYSTEESDKLQRALDEQNKKLIITKTLLQNYTDEQLKGVIDQLNMADAYDQSTAALEKQVFAMRKQIDTANKASESVEKLGDRVKAGTVKDKLSTRGISNEITPLSMPTQLVTTPGMGVDVYAEELERLTRQLQALSAAQDIIDSMGDAMRSLAGDTKAARIATASLVVVTQALAVAEAIKTAGSKGDPYTVAVRIAAAAAACVSAFAAIGFADGGIVPGSGGRKSDKVNVRASAGEMILTGQQQANLFHMINSGNSGNSGGNVEFVIRGQQLVGVLNNYNNKRNRTI